MADEPKAMFIRGQELTKEQAAQIIEMFESPGYRQYQRILRAIYSHEIEEVFLQLNNENDEVSDAIIRESRGIASLANDLIEMPGIIKAEAAEVFAEENKTA